MKRTVRAAMLMAALSFSAALASAWQVTAKVTAIEATWVPDRILFQLDAGMTNCTAWPWLFYYGNTAAQTTPTKSVQAAYAGLLAALQSGKKVTVVGSGCDIINVQLTSQ